MTAEQINAKLFKAKADKIKIYPCNNLRASNLGHPCERYLYLLIKHWDEQKPHDVGLQNIFDLGNTLEEHTIKNIKEHTVSPLSGNGWESLYNGYQHLCGDGSPAGFEVFDYDGDKLKATGLDYEMIDGVPVFNDARLTVIGRKLYADDIKENCFIDEKMLSHYAAKDYHRFYVCEIEKVLVKE